MAGLVWVSNRVEGTTHYTFTIIHILFSNDVRKGNFGSIW